MSLAAKTALLATQVLNVHLDPAPAFKFFIYLEINGVIEAGFSEVSGLSAERQVESYEEGGRHDYVHKLPGRTTYSNITLKRGIGFSTLLWDWFETGMEDFKVKKTNMSIIQLSSYSVMPARWYNLEDAWPVRWNGPNLNAESDTIAIEEVEIAYSKLTLDSVSRAALAAFL